MKLEQYNDNGYYVWKGDKLEARLFLDVNGHWFIEWRSDTFRTKEAAIQWIHYINDEEDGVLSQQPTQFDNSVVE